MCVGGDLLLWVEVRVGVFMCVCAFGVVCVCSFAGLWVVFRTANGPGCCLHLVNTSGSSHRPNNPAGSELRPRELVAEMISRPRSIF